ncbi:Uncharacterised protein [Vibrio cholerae]|nr:Uncharacterised protein [Vibrio cholerae]
MKSGKTNKLNSTPPFCKPTVSATPIAPIKLSVGVPSNRVSTTASQAELSNESKIASSGLIKISGKPVSSQ